MLQLCVIDCEPGRGRIAVGLGMAARVPRGRCGSPVRSWWCDSCRCLCVARCGRTLLPRRSALAVPSLDLQRWPVSGEGVRRCLERKPAGVRGDALVVWAECTGRGRAGGHERGGLRFAFYGRVSTEDHQDPVTSLARQQTQAPRPSRDSHPPLPAGRAAALRDVREAAGISLVQRQARLPVPPRSHHRQHASSGSAQERVCP